jgi:uncharacterized protein
MADIASLRPVDCDLHIMVPDVGLRVFMPYLDEYWRDHIASRGTQNLNLQLSSYPPNAPLTARPDWRAAGLGLEAMRRDALDAFGSRLAVCHTVWSPQMFHSEDLAAALCRAMNDWIAAEWLDKEPRLRAAMVVPAQNAELAVEEIERRAGDSRFVSIQILALGELPLGRRAHWPIYAAAERHDLPIDIHAGSSYRHPVKPSGWGSFAVEDYVDLAAGFSSQLVSLVTEGVFVKFPRLRVVLVESGFTWLPGCLWRLDKTWRGIRREVPWLTSPPSEQVREHVRVTLQPHDAPPDAAQLERVLEHIGSDDMLLFATDWPHWQFDEDRVLPDGFPERLLQKLCVENPLATYRRMAVREAVA